MDLLAIKSYTVYHQKLHHDMISLVCPACHDAMIVFRVVLWDFYMLCVLSSVQNSRCPRLAVSSVGLEGLLVRPLAFQLGDLP
eukprot:1143048-Pelagomonas_calceolata.AAC.3